VEQRLHVPLARAHRDLVDREAAQQAAPLLTVRLDALRESLMA